MDNPAEILKTFTPKKEFFIGIDSDGCAFDTMEIKHKECFCPAFINHFELQPVSRYARQTWEFVNLYSRTRGINRFIAVEKSLELLKGRKETAARNVKIPRMESLKKWLEKETKLGNPALKREMEKTDDPDLKNLYAWSEDVNRAVAKIVRNVAPFPFVRESLEKMSTFTDTVVVSSTSVEALQREWAEHDIAQYVKLIAGQEMGPKKDHIRYTAFGKYDPSKILVVGDAPGDLKAAKENGALFFPIVPGREETSWERFFSEGFEKFLKGTYSGTYEKSLINTFLGSLPELPPWQK